MQPPGAARSLRPEWLDARTCPTWDGSSFVAPDCSARRWLRTRGITRWWYSLPSALPPTGGAVRSYRLFSRVVIASGEREDRFDFGRNKVDFFAQYRRAVGAAARL